MPPLPLLTLLPAGVARDDLPDGGSWLYAETVRQIRQQSPGTGVEPEAMAAADSR